MRKSPSDSSRSITLFREDEDKFPIHEMVRKGIPQTLKPQAQLKFVQKGGKELHDEEEIYELCRRILDVLNVEYEMQQRQNGKSRGRGGSNNSSRNHSNSDDREKKDYAPCHKHDGTHKWKDCPNNWCNRNGTPSYNAPASSNYNSNSSARARGQVNSTERNSHNPKDTPVVRFDFDNKSMQGTRSFRGEVMEIKIRGTTKGNLHPITIIMLPDDKQCRIATKALLDKYCMGKGLILWDLVNALHHATSAGDVRTFNTAAGTFLTNELL
jgi:hypothetical protein